MATAESLAHELRSRAWNATAVEGETGWICEIDEDNQNQPVDLNVYHYGPNCHVWLAGRTTHEAPDDIDTRELADRVINSIKEDASHFVSTPICLTVVSTFSGVNLYRFRAGRSLAHDALVSVRDLSQ